jgi:uncharacterized membrane protein HdeD (DUF308 family)
LEKQEHIMSTTSASNPSSPDMSAASLEPLNAILAQNWWVVALRGVLGIVFGLIAFFFPGPTMLSFVLVFATYALVDGVFAIVAAIRAARRRDRWGFLTFEGIVNIAAAILAVLWPGLTLLIFVMIVAAWAIVTGILMFSASRNLDTEHGRWWLALGGLVSIVYGILLVAAPLIGAVVLTWWIGAYAFGFGIALLILAFRLRSCRVNRSQDAVAHGAT